VTESPYTDADMVAIYERVSAPHQFDGPARALVELLRPTSRALVLDVGAGTGTVGVYLRAATGSTGRVVAVDRSLSMLRLATRKTMAAAAASVPGLPFRDDSFEFVTAGFVVSHLADYREGLADLVRVCRAGGRVGMTAWGSLTNPAGQLWSDVAGRFVEAARLDQAFREHIPWDAWFSRAANVTAALEEAHLAALVVETRTFDISMPTTDFLASRHASIQGIVLRRQLAASELARFEQSVSLVFHDRFGANVRYRRDVHFGIGTKP
jgi:SAM-dependent methyltransferase